MLFILQRFFHRLYNCHKVDGEDVILLSQGKWENDTLLPETPIFNLVFQ